VRPTPLKQPGEMPGFFKFYVYILQSLSNGSYYKGCTDDLERRFNEHNDGKEFSTKRNLPWKPAWFTTKPTLSEARQLEQKLKNITGRQRIQSFIEKYSKGGPDEA
jgi:putative endonuclease